MVGGLLEACERLVDRERLSHVLAELRAHTVDSQTANESQKGGYQRNGVSAAADTFVSVTCGAKGRVATYLSDVRLLFVVRASPSALAPSY